MTQVVPPDDNETMAPAPWAEHLDIAPDEWSPSNEPLNTFGVGEPSHADLAHAMPMSEQPGEPPEGTAVRPNYTVLDDVRARSTTPAPKSVVHHVMEEVERGSEAIRVRVVSVQGNVAPTPLLEQNPNRRRAMLRIVPPNPTTVNAATTIVVPVGNPAAGADWSTTVPAGFSWEVVAITEVLATSAVVANRVPRIAYGGVLVGIAPNVQAASLTEGYLFGEGLTADAIGTSTPPQNVAPLPVVSLPSGTTIASSVLSLSAGDQLSGIFLLVRQTPNGVVSPSVWIAPRAMGGGQSAQSAWWKMIATDDEIKIETQDGVDAICANATDAVLVQVYEELVGTAPQAPGLL